MEELMEVIVRDGNRVVNWEFPRDATITDVLAKWKKGYYPFESIVFNGVKIKAENIDAWRLSSFDGNRIRLLVHTKFPKRKKEDED